MSNEIRLLPDFANLRRRMAQARSSSPVLETCLERIARFDARMHAFVAVFADEARQASSAMDQAWASQAQRSALHGIPVGLKDVIEFRGHVTAGGSAAHGNRYSLRTATCAQRLLDAGMIIVGKTHTVEFAFSAWGENQHLGTPWNPWDATTHRAPGGSSSGSAVAVAAGLLPCAVGTDTGGSVRVPAAFCGITALKPTRGRISNFGVMPCSASFDSPGPMGRSVVDVAALFDAMQGPDPHDPRTARFDNEPTGDTLRAGVAGRRLGRMPAAERERVAGDVLARYDASLAVLAALGAEIVDVDLPFSFVDCGAAQATIVRPEAYATYRHLVDDAAQPLDDAVRAGIRNGGEIPAHEYVAARRMQGERSAQMNQALDGVDALLTPTTETAAPPLASIDRNRMPSRFTRFVNFLDMCALALPNGSTDAGLPTSLQIVCRHGEDAAALRIGCAFQSATEWHRRTPDITGFATDA